MTERTFGTIEEVLAFAIRRETEAAVGYARIAALAETPGLRELAEELKAQEESHRRLLEGLDAGAIRGLKAAYVPDLRVVDALADETVAPDMSLQEMLIFAAKKEAQAVDLYETLARTAAAADLERLFRFLAGQEREHKLRLEAAYEQQILQEN